MADGIRAVVDAMQPSGPDAAPDRAVREPELTELRARHHAVLPLGQRRDLGVGAGWDQICPHTDHF
jgi:hypothetical protein